MTPEEVRQLYLHTADLFRQIASEHPKQSQTYTTNRRLAAYFQRLADEQAKQEKQTKQTKQTP